MEPGSSNFVVLVDSDRIVQVPPKATSSTRKPALAEPKPQAASSATAADATPSKDGAASSEPEHVAELDARGLLLQAMQEEKVRVEDELARLRSKTEIAPKLEEETELSDVSPPAVPRPALQPQRKRSAPLPPKMAVEPMRHRPPNQSCHSFSLI